MYDAAAEPANPTAPAETSARERMGILRRMSEIGLRMAERLDRSSEIAAARAESAAIPDDPAHDSRLQDAARAFAQVSRAVSVCIALEDRIERGPPERPPIERPPLGPELVCAVPRESRLKTRRKAVESGVRLAIERACAHTPVRIDQLCRRLDDVLDRELAAVDTFLTRPTGEIITRLCERLGIDPELAIPSPPPPQRGGAGAPGSGGGGRATAASAEELWKKSPLPAAPLHHASRGPPSPS